MNIFKIIKNKLTKRIPEYVTYNGRVIPIGPISEDELREIEKEIKEMMEK